MHFTYADSGNPDLEQGDILRRSEALVELLDEVHPHYKDPKNKYFIVLTQSCDMVRRDGGLCGARYITIAAVRPFVSAYQREIEQNRLPHIEGMPAVPVCDDRAKNRIAQFLQRLLNNNESYYFFLKREPTMGFPEDCCAFLRLSIAIKTNLHYEKLIAARTLRLSEPFKAKLGWLVGQIYSRVGTQDWDPDELNSFVIETLKAGAYWVESRKAKLLDSALREYRTLNPGRVLSEKEFTDLVKKIPKKKELVLNRIREIVVDSIVVKSLQESGQLSEADIEAIIRALRGDPKLTNLLL